MPPLKWKDDKVNEINHDLLDKIKKLKEINELLKSQMEIIASQGPKMKPNFDDYLRGYARLVDALDLGIDITKYWTALRAKKVLKEIEELEKSI